MEEIECIFCESESSRVVIEENGFQGKQCSQCGLIYISPRPSLNETIDLYGHDSANISAESHISAAFLKTLYARHHLKIVGSFAKGGALLEIGPGAGYFLDEARRLGFEPHGLELNSVQAGFIRNTLNIPCEESILSTSVFEGKKFDIVYHCDVISHFFDPIAEFRKINRILKDDSLHIFETGNLGEVDQSYFRYIHKFQYPDHLFFYSTDNLVDLLEQTGFELLKLYRYSILPQLVAIEVLSGVKNFVERHVLKADEEEKHPSDRSGVGKPFGADSQSFGVSLLSKHMKNVYRYLNYILRYRVGRIVPKARRPQTVIVVARKRCQSD